MMDRPAGRLGLALTGVLAVAAILAPLLAPADPYAITGPSLAPPGGAHPLGTDALGRDLLSGLLFGARTSLGVAVAVGLIVLVIGGLVGGFSGYLGGRWDEALMRMTEFFQALPRFFLAILAIAVFGPGLDRLVIVLGLTSWTMLARVVRSEVLSLREREFILAARALGASNARIVLRELLPNALPAALALLGLIMGNVLLLEAGLGFLGLGDPNAITWGLLAGAAQPYLRLAWWLPFFPGVAILAAVLGLNLLGDALTGALGAETRGVR
jgi:peptide/nickel transport system permease protein